MQNRLSPTQRPSYHVPVPCRPQPLKQRPEPVELRAMTLCIAAQFRLKPPHVEEPMAAFVLCSDGRLSQGAWGSDDAAIKTHTLGYNFMALLAGDWPTVVNMGDQLSADFQNAAKPENKSEVAKLIGRSLDGFATSGLCPPKAHLESIVTGFIDKQPVMFRAEVKNRKRLRNPS
jgi:hypothetical protein